MRTSSGGPEAPAKPPSHASLPKPSTAQIAFRKLDLTRCPQPNRATPANSAPTSRKENPLMSLKWMPPLTAALIPFATCGKTSNSPRRRVPIKSISLMKRTCSQRKPSTRYSKRLRNHRRMLSSSWQLRSMPRFQKPSPPVAKTSISGTWKMKKLSNACN